MLYHATKGDATLIPQALHIFMSIDSYTMRYTNGLGRCGFLEDERARKIPCSEFFLIILFGNLGGKCMKN